MEPRIQYTKTSDGVSIAFWTLGEGRPLVYMPNHPYSHIQLAWQLPELSGSYQRLAEKGKVIAYDGRGCGLSERDVEDHSLDALVLDLEAVVDRLGLETFALLGLFSSGPAAITYAARHPERLSHLILSDTYARHADLMHTPQLQALTGLRENDWELYTETLAHVLFGWSEGEQAHRFAVFMRQCVTPDAGSAIIAARQTLDVTNVLPQVRTRTLVLQHADILFPTMDIARGLASRIPDARLTILQGRPLSSGDTVETEIHTIKEFLGQEAEGPETTSAPSGLVTVLFTDLVGHSEMMARLGDERGRAVLREHERITREVLQEHGGTEVKTMGDGFMASFASVTKALECVIALQAAFNARNATAAEPLHIRVGLNAGEPIAEEGDLFGASVILAARIAARAGAGEILIPEPVRHLLAGKGFLFADRGEHVLRGFEDPVRLFEVRWQGP